MDAWEGWDFQRFYLLFVGAAFVLLGVQVFLFHWRAPFRKRSMYLPRLPAPLLALAARVDRLTRFGGDLEPVLRTLIARLLPGVEVDVDLAAFADSHAEHTLGRGDRAPGVPPVPQLLRQGLEILARRGFANAPESEQDALIARMRRGEADTALGLPATEFV